MYVGQSFDHAVKAGLLLIEAKQQFPHGGWLKWLKANVKIGVRQAQNYMKVATAPDEKRNAVAHLSMRKAIHALGLQKVVRESDSAEPEPDDDEPTKPEPTKPEPDAVEPEPVVGDADDDDDEDEIAAETAVPGASPKKRRTSAEVKADYVKLEIFCFERRWDTCTQEIREGYLQHIVKESDPVALAARILTMMDSDQLRRFCVMVDQHKLNVGRKRASTLPTEPRSEVGVDDPMPENEGDDLELPACLDRRSVQKERAASS
jgi:Protein of unknown function (DUF3102)